MAKNKYTCPLCNNPVKISQYHDVYYCEQCDEFVDPQESQTVDGKINYIRDGEA